MSNYHNYYLSYSGYISYLSQLQEKPGKMPSFQQSKESLQRFHEEMYLKVVGKTSLYQGYDLSRNSNKVSELHVLQMTLMYSE